MKEREEKAYAEIERKLKMLMIEKYNLEYEEELENSEGATDSIGLLQWLLNGHGWDLGVYPRSREFFPLDFLNETLMHPVSNETIRLELRRMHQYYAEQFIDECECYDSFNLIFDYLHLLLSIEQSERILAWIEEF